MLLQQCEYFSESVPLGAHQFGTMHCASTSKAFFTAWYLSPNILNNSYNLVILKMARLLYNQMHLVRGHIFFCKKLIVKLLSDGTDLSIQTVGGAYVVFF